jgi:hypothetical protein
MIFLGPEKAVGGGGAPATGEPSAADGKIDLKEHYPGLDIDNLDDASRAALEASVSRFATLQTEQQKAVEQMRQFQSRADSAAAELNRIKTSISGNQPAQTPEEKQMAEIEQTMVNSGVNPQQAKLQAPVMQALLKAQRDNILKEVGSGLQPMMNMTLTQNAERAFNFARASDSTGAFSIPDVSQAIWNSCQELINSGSTITDETVQNLKRMHFMAHAEKNPAIFATLQMNSGVPPLNPGTVPGSRIPINLSTGGYNFPGANFNSMQPQNVDPNAPKTHLDQGTRDALNQVFSKMTGKNYTVKG